MPPSVWDCPASSSAAYRLRDRAAYITSWTLSFLTREMGYFRGLLPGWGESAYPNIWHALGAKSRLATLTGVPSGPRSRS